MKATLDKKRLSKRNTILGIIFLGLLVVFMAMSEDLVGPYVVRILNTSAIYAICALSLNLVNGFTGLFSLGQSGFMALGAYATALLIISPEVKSSIFYLEPIVPWLANVQIPFVFALIVGGLVAALAAFLIGFPVLRLRGDYLAIASLGFSEIIRVVLSTAQSVTNGPLGIKNIPDTANIWWNFGVLAVVTVFLILLLKTSYGRSFKAIREDEVAAQSMGISLFKHKMLSFVISGFIAGVGGGLLASVVGTIDPLQFRFILTYNILLMVVLGGQASISGSIVGAFLVTSALEFLRFMDEPINFGAFTYPGIAGMRMVVFSALLVIVIIFWSRGIFGDSEFSFTKIIDWFKALPGRLKKLFSKKAKEGGRA